MKKRPKFLVRTDIEIKTKINAYSFLLELLDKIEPENFIKELTQIYYFKGYPALTGLPLVTNKKSLSEIEMCAILFYVIKKKKKLMREAMTLLNKALHKEERQKR